MTSTTPPLTHTLKTAAGPSIPIPNLCIGTWSWGDAKTWGYDASKHRAQLDMAFAAQRKAGLLFLDTAEIYGKGESERIIKELIRDEAAKQREQGASEASLPSPKDWILASKWTPIPWPLSRNFLPAGMVGPCRASLERLGVDKMHLYQVHGPVHLRSIEAVAQGLAECVKLGLTDAVGVSNYSKDEMIRMDEALKKHGVPLASNQVEFSLLRTLPEATGLLEECHKRGIVLLAYSALAMGRLSGRYSASNPPPSQRWFSRHPMERIEPLLEVQRELAEKYDVKPSAIALRWVIQKGAVPIGGARNEEQVAQNAKAFDGSFSLTQEEMKRLEERSLVGGEDWLQRKFWQHG